MFSLSFYIIKNLTESEAILYTYANTFWMLTKQFFINNM